LTRKRAIAFKVVVVVMIRRDKRGTWEWAQELSKLEKLIPRDLQSRRKWHSETHRNGLNELLSYCTVQVHIRWV
jgi:hypothetical protein